MLPTGAWQRTHSHLQPPKKMKLQLRSIEITTIRSLTHGVDNNFCCISSPACKYEVNAMNSSTIENSVEIMNAVHLLMIQISYLMGTTYEVQIVFMEKLRNNFCSKGEWHTPVIFSPAHDLFIWVRPQQVAQKPLVRHICWPHDPTNLFHRLQVWTQPCNEMHQLLHSYVNLSKRNYKNHAYDVYTSIF